MADDLRRARFNADTALGEVADELESVLGRATCERQRAQRTGSGASSYFVNGGSFTVQSIFVSTNDQVYASNCGNIQFSALEQDVHQKGRLCGRRGFALLDRDRHGGGAAVGSITIDGGSNLTGSGTFDAPTIAVNAALAVGAGETFYMESRTGCNLGSRGAGQNCGGLWVRGQGGYRLAERI